MKKEELRQIIREEIQQGDYPELHRVVTDKTDPPFMTEADFEAKWNKKLGLDEKLVSFDTKEIVKRAKPLFVLLGDKQLNKGKLVGDIFRSLKKHSSLPPQV